MFADGRLVVVRVSINSALENWRCVHVYFFDSVICSFP